MANVNFVDDGFAEAGVDEITTVRKEMMNGFGTNIKSLKNFSTTFNKLTKAIEDLAKTHEQLTITYNNFDKHKSSSLCKTKQEKEKLENMEDSLDEALQLFDMGVKETYAKLTTFPDPRRTTRRIKKRMENVEEQLKQSGYMEDIVSYFMDFGRLPADFVESNFPNSGNLIQKPIETPSLQIQRCPKDSEIDAVVQTDERAKNKGSLDFFTEYHIEDVKEESVEDIEVAVLQEQCETLLEYREIDYNSDESFAGSEDSDSSSSDGEYCAIAARHAKDKNYPIKRSLSVGDTIPEWRNREPVVEYHIAEEQNSFWNKAAPEVEKRKVRKAEEVQHIDISLDKQLGTEDQKDQNKTPESKYAKRLLEDSSSEEPDSDSDDTSSEESESDSDDTSSDDSGLTDGGSTSEDDKSSLDTEESTTDDEMLGLEQMDERDGESRKMQPNWDEEDRKILLNLFNNICRLCKGVEPKMIPTTEPIVVQGTENLMPASQLITDFTETTRHPEVSQIVTEKTENRLLEDSSSEESDSDSDNSSSDGSDSTDGDSTSEDDKSSLDTEESTTDDEMPGLEQMDERDFESRRMPSNSEAARKLYLYNDRGTSSDISNNVQFMEEMLRRCILIEADEMNEEKEQKMTPSTETIIVQTTENSMPASQLITASTEPAGLPEVSKIVTEMKENLVAEKSAINGSLDFFTEYHIEVEAGSLLGLTYQPFNNRFSYSHIIDVVKEGSPLAKAVDPQLILNKEIICVNGKLVKNIDGDELEQLIRDILNVGGTVSLGIIHEPFTNKEPIKVDVKEAPVQDKEVAVLHRIVSQLINGSTEPTRLQEESQIVHKMKENLVADKSTVNAEESIVVTKEPGFTVVELLIILAVIVNIIVLLML